MSKTMNRLACAAITLALALAAPRAADAGPKQDARAHMDRAAEAHQAGDLDRALEELRAAYAIDPRPQLLYALGQIYTKLGRCSEASDAYLRFLARGADARTTEVVKQAIGACQPPAAAVAAAPPPPAEPAKARPAPPPKPAKAAKAKPKAKAKSKAAQRTTRSPRRVAATPAPDPAPPPPRSGAGSPWYRDVLGDVLVVSGVASGVLGGLAYRAAITDLDTAETVSGHDRYTEIVDGARTKRLYAAAFAGAGVALVTAGVLRFALRDRPTEVRRVGVLPARGGGLLSWTRSF